MSAPDVQPRPITYSPAMADAHNYIRWVLSRFNGYLRGRILEVGLGHGSFYPQLANAGRYLGLDIDPASVTEAKQRFPEGEFVEGDLTSPHLSARLGGPVDAIVCVNVLEHIENDAAAASNLVEVLRPGGHLLLGVPAFPALYNDLDRLGGHYRRYVKSSVAALIPHDAAEIIRLEYFNAIGGVGWWANNFVRHRSLDTTRVASQVRAFDKLIVPLSRLIDPLMRGRFGQSVICIARRRSDA